MKTRISLLALFSSLIICFGWGFTNIDYTTIYSAQTYTNDLNMTIPGVATNSHVVIVTTNRQVGDSLPLTAVKINAAWAYLTNFFATNSTGTGGTSNAIPIYNGGGTNLTVTNTFTLISTTPYYGIASLFFPSGTWNNTNWDGTYYDASGTYGAGYMTNSYGNVIYVGPLTNTPATLVSSIWVTNGVGAGRYYPLDASYSIYTNSYLNYSTNNASYITVSNAVSDFVGVYKSTGNSIYSPFYFGTTNSPAFTNLNGLTIIAAEPTNSATVTWVAAYKNQWSGNLYNGNYYGASASTNPPQGYTSTGYPCCGAFSTGTNAIFTFYVTTNNIANATNWNWAYYDTLAWRFFSETNAQATNVVFYGRPTNSIALAYSTNTLPTPWPTNLFYVTNTVYAAPDSNLTYTANNGNPVIFSTTNGTISDLGGNGLPNYWGMLPGADSIFVVSLGTNYSITSSNVVIGGGGGSGIYPYWGGPTTGTGWSKTNGLTAWGKFRGNTWPYVLLQH